MKALIPGAALALLVSLGAAAQEASEEAERVCVLAARYYSGTVEEIRNLRADPAPPSFRSALEDTGSCATWTALETTLIRLHLRHGDEASATAALDFLDFAAGAYLPTGAAETRSRAEKRARQLAGLAPLEAATEEKSGDAQQASLEAYYAAVREIESPPEFSYYFQSALTLDAAEYYGSRKLLDRAAKAFQSAERAARLSAQLRPAKIPGSEETRLKQEQDQRADLEQRLSLLQARISRRPSDIERAHQRVLRGYDPAFSLAADFAESNLQDPCDADAAAFGDEGRAIPAPELCDETNELPRRAQDFWYRLAIVEMLMAANNEEFRPLLEEERAALSAGGKTPVSMLTRARNGDRKRAATDPHFDSVGWTSASRWNHRRLAVRNHQTAEWRSPHEAPYLYDQFGATVLEAGRLLPKSPRADGGSGYTTAEFLEDLSSAMRLVEAYDHPAHWRRMAAAFVAAADAEVATSGAPRSPDEEARYRHVRAVLARLERCGAFCE